MMADSTRQSPKPLGLATRLQTRAERQAGKGRAKLRKDDRRAQETILMMKRLFGDASIKDLAGEFHLTTRTVERRLETARIEGIPDAARQVFIQDMLPASMAVLKEALEGDDIRLATSVALKIVEGLKAMDAAKGAAEGSEETFELFRARLVRRGADPADPGIIDGVLDASGDADPSALAPNPTASLAAAGPDGASPVSLLASPGSDALEPTSQAAPDQAPAGPPSDAPGLSTPGGAYASADPARRDGGA